MAERNVAEQRRYIAELERVSRELQESREHFRHAAFHDALTNLPNRALLADHLRLAIERAGQSAPLTPGLAPNGRDSSLSRLRQILAA